MIGKLVSSIFCLFMLASIRGQASVQKIDFAEILKRVDQKYNTSDLIKAKHDMLEQSSINEAILDNPVVSYGRGRLRYNGGTGVADYEEFSVSQKIPINGSRRSLRKQGRILGEIGKLEGLQSKLSLSKSALLAGIRFSIDKEKFQYIDERRRSLLLVSRFLRNRRFGSPKKQIEVQLIESKLEEVDLETKELVSSLNSSRKILSLYIGGFDESLVDIQFLDGVKLKMLAERISKNDLIESKKFSYKEQYYKMEEVAASRKWIPDLKLSYTQSNERFSGGNRNRVIGLGIEIPLFNIGKSKKKALSAKKSASKIEYEISKIQKLAVKKNLLNNIQVGLDYIGIYNEKKVNKKEKVLKKFEKYFKKGLISASNFLDLEDGVHMIHNRRLESFFEIYDGLMGLVELAGDDSSLKEIF